MEHAVADENQVHMGLPMPNGKLAMWLFLVTEIMFFTALIGTYLILRSGAPSAPGAVFHWPTPHVVHLAEWIGALNTFVLICSSFTVVLSHWALHRGDTSGSLRYMIITLALGCVFLVVKGFEYKAKFDHEILPGRIYEKLSGPTGNAFVRHVESQLVHIVETYQPTTEEGKKAKTRCEALLVDIKNGMPPKLVNEQIVGTKQVPKGDMPESRMSDEDVTGILELEPSLHLSYSIPYGNMWASCYFAMTGFHAIHVLGGLVIFVIVIVMGLRGSLSKKHETMLEATGLYWHFVDIVWIFLFPLLYLV